MCLSIFSCTTPLSGGRIFWDKKIQMVNLNKNKTTFIDILSSVYRGKTALIVSGILDQF